MGRYNDSQPEFRERPDRSNRRSGGRDRNRSSRRDNRDGGFRERSGGFDRRPSDREMHNVICDKCGKECQVPFKPSTDKPVYCNDCFRSNDSRSGSRDNSRNDRPQSSGISSEQFNQLNTKLDKIIELLESCFEDDEEIEDEEEEEIEEKPKKVKKDKNL
ncbi:MAG: hypothetical protein PHF86_11920 [Candidatus Nanoarchaeia archaeon]|nr:hypothetical protein [Candidatus Nanoarchaeia archaeon]